jgi:hypothetical protein
MNRAVLAASRTISILKVSSPGSVQKYSGLSCRPLGCVVVRWPLPFEGGFSRTGSQTANGTVDEHFQIPVSSLISPESS